MSSKRLFQIFCGLIILLALAIVIVAYLLVGQFHNRGLHLQDQRQAVAVKDSQAASLKQAKADIKEYNQLAQIANAIVPKDKDQTQTVREIVKLANEAGIEVGSIQFPQSDLGATGKGAKSPALSQLEPVPGISGVLGLQITVSSGTNNYVLYSQFINFLSRLEHNRRTALVTSINLQPDLKDSSKISYSIVLEEYIKP